MLGYASGRFQQQQEVARFLATHPQFPHDRNGEVHPSRVKELLTRPIYAGYIEAPSWNILLRKGLHEPIISYETFMKIQDRLNGVTRAPQRKDLSADFPLRGAVMCGHCGALLTACWSKGRSALHPYYHCKSRGCDGYKKSIRRDVIEGEFAVLLQEIEPPPRAFKVAQVMFRKMWDHMTLTSKTRAKDIADEIAKLDRGVQQCLDKIIAVDAPVVIAALEKRIREHEEQKIVLAERKAACERPVRSFEETVRTALQFLATPCLLWDFWTLEARRMVLRLAFAGPLVYTQNEGFRTADLSLPFKALAGLGGGENPKWWPGSESKNAGSGGILPVMQVRLAGVTRKVTRRFFWPCRLHSRPVGRLPRLSELGLTMHEVATPINQTSRTGPGY